MRKILLLVGLLVCGPTWAADLCRVSTAAPDYSVTTNDNAISCDRSGGVRTQMTDGAGNTIGTSDNPEYIQGNVSSSPAAPTTATGTITTTQCVQLTGLQAQATVGVSITGTMTTGGIAGFKTVTTTYPAAANATLRAQPVGTTGSGTTVTAIGSFTVDTAGMQQFEVCGNNTFSGSAVVTLRTTTAGETSIDGFGILAGSAGVPSVVAITTQPPTESTAAIATTTLAGADATISAADTTSAERIITNNGSATAYIALGATAVSGTGIQLTVGATYIEDRYRGAIHAIGTGAIDVQKVSP